jgi:2-polyprenyl-3-methyl-5-hydroxy-6-metoxy-1,4-benzoquinol methylase
MEEKNKTEKKYTFLNVHSCNMCGNPTRNNKVMGIRLNQSQGLNPKSKTGIAVSVIKCAACNLIYSNPLPIPNNIQDHYGLPPEEYWQNQEFKWDENYFKAEIIKLKTLMEIKPGMKALDIGAGLGRTMISLDKAGFETYGFEPSEPFYKKAIEKMGISPNRLKLGSLEDMQYEPNLFDFISFGSVLEHVYNPAKSIEIALNWLKPNGIIHIEVPSSNHYPTRLINKYYKLKGTNYVSNISPMHSPFHLYEFDIKSFKALSAKLNFSIASNHIEVCEVLNFPRFTHPLLKKWMKLTNSGLQLIMFLKKEL